MWTDQQRSLLGPKFSEGARQSWLALERLGWSQSRLEAELAKLGANVTAASWLYGDKKPGRVNAVRLKRLLDVDLELWDEPSADPGFVPPVLVSKTKPEAA